jgi:hypothetical protein
LNGIKKDSEGRVIFNECYLFANDLQQGDLITEFTKFPAFCIARGIVAPAWEHKKTGQRKCLKFHLTKMLFSFKQLSGVKGY